MSVLSTYGELKTGLGDYSGRAANVTWLANLPLFVRRAHDVAMRELRIPLLQTTTDLTINAERVAVPADYRAPVRLFIDGAYDSPLTPTSVEMRVKEAVTQSSSRPRVFSREGGYLAFGPIPDTTYTGKLLYYRTLAFFASDAATNDLLTLHPWIYFYGAMAEAARFDKSDEDIMTYEAMFRAEIDAVNTSELTDSMAGGTLMPTPSGGVA
jgi:hypothetical protein